MVIQNPRKSLKDHGGRTIAARIKRTNRNNRYVLRNTGGVTTDDSCDMSSMAVIIGATFICGINIGRTVECPRIRCV